MNAQRTQRNAEENLSLAGIVSGTLTAAQLGRNRGLCSCSPLCISRVLCGLMRLLNEPGTQNRRRHLPRHARRRAAAGRAAEAARGRRDVPVQPRARTTPDARSSGCSGRASCARSAAPRCSRTTACVTLLYGTLLPGPDIGRRCADALRAVRDAGLRGRHPHLGPRQVAGRRGAARTPPGPRARWSSPCERFEEIFGDRAAGARRRRLADEPARLPPDAACWASTTAPTPAAAVPFVPIYQRRDRRLSAVADHPADARRADRRWTGSTPNNVADHRAAT